MNYVEYFSRALKTGKEKKNREKLMLFVLNEQYKSYKFSLFEFFKFIAVAANYRA